MSFIDDVYSMYREHLHGDEDDAVAIAFSILENQSKDHVMQLINEMKDEEVVQMMGIYLIEMIKMKMAEEGKVPCTMMTTSSPYH